MINETKGQIVLELTRGSLTPTTTRRGLLRAPVESLVDVMNLQMEQEHVLRSALELAMSILSRVSNSTGAVPFTVEEEQELSKVVNMKEWFADGNIILEPAPPK
jgi:hypothetical protein